MVRIRQKCSRIRIHGENRTNIFENQNSWRESNRSIRELEFIVRIRQKYSRIRIHSENRTKVFENQNSWRESNRNIREIEFMVRIGQKYSRIRIHVENRTKVFENQNMHNFTGVPGNLTLLPIFQSYQAIFPRFPPSETRPHKHES